MSVGSQSETSELPVHLDERSIPGLSAATIRRVIRWAASADPATAGVQEIQVQAAVRAYGAWQNDRFVVRGEVRRSGLVR